MQIEVDIRKTPQDGATKMIVDAEVVGRLAYHVSLNDADVWVATHAPTGLALAHFDNAVHARWFCEIAAPMADSIVAADPAEFASLCRSTADGRRFITLCRLVRDLWNAIQRNTDNDKGYDF